LTSNKCAHPIIEEVNLLSNTNFISCCVKQCKCENKHTYMVLHGYVKQCEKCDFYLGRGRIS
jgi:hypothetical protein